MNNMKKYFNLLVFCLLVSTTAQAHKPEPEYWIRPDSLGLKYVEKKLITSDNAQLLSWLLPTPVAKPLRKTLVIAYAGTGNMANSVYYANAFLKSGFDVVLFDYRGFGHSSKFDVKPDRLYHQEFITDLQTAIKAAKAQFPKNKTGVLSFSMSTILATLANQQEPIDFLIGEGYVNSPESIVQFWKKDSNSIITLPEQTINYPKAVSQIRCPMLLIAGTEDPITSLASARSVVAQRHNRSLLTYKGDHLEATKVWQEKEFADGYVKRIRDFVVRI